MLPSDPVREHYVLYVLTTFRGVSLHSGSRQNECALNFPCASSGSVLRRAALSLCIDLKTTTRQTHALEP